jgi:hypothetical protein
VNAPRVVLFPNISISPRKSASETPGFLPLTLHWCCKPPSVTFQIPRPIFTLTIRLIDRLAVDAGARQTRALVVCVDVIDVDDQAEIRHIHGERRIEMVLSGDAMEPDGCIPARTSAWIGWPSGFDALLPQRTQMLEPGSRAQLGCPDR